MRKMMSEWFFMRHGFDTFQFEPEKHARYVFGERDRKQRDLLLNSLEEASFSRAGFKAAIYGDYGRGKTHQCHNLEYEIKRLGLPFVPVYVKCSAFKKKEPFNSLFREMIFRHPENQISELATDYQNRVKAGDEPPLAQVVQSQDVASVMDKMLTVPNEEVVKQSLRYLAGDKIDLAMLGTLKPQLQDPADFGDVMRGLSHMFIAVHDAVPLYIVDEAERLGNITDTDTFHAWTAAFRELTEIQGVAMLLMVGAKGRDFLPTILVQDEIVRRIGVANYIELVNPPREDLRTFLLEQFQTSIRKGQVPESQREVVDAEALDEAVPDDLMAIVGEDSERLKAFPFDPDALEEFLSQISSGDLTNKPSEAQLRVQKAASKSMRLGKRTITFDVVESLAEEIY